MEFALEFEDLYYQCMESRIHFVRHSVHLLMHMGPETFHIGPLACYVQWTLETAIGNLDREIRQDRDIFTNLTQRAVIRAQVNSLGWFMVAQLGSNLGPNLGPNFDQVGNAKLGRFGKLGRKSDSDARFASQLDP